LGQAAAKPQNHILTNPAWLSTPLIKGRSPEETKWRVSDSPPFRRSAGIGPKNPLTWLSNLCNTISPDAPDDSAELKTENGELAEGAFHDL